MFKNTLLFILNLGFITSAFAQSSEVNFNSKVIPTSPTMTTLNRFVDYPVDYSTGLAQVSIPIYTINVGGYTFPIDIDFHASGRRLGNSFSAMGVGWALNATGYISREIRDRPDDLYQSEETTYNQVSSGTGAYPLYYGLRPMDIGIPNPPPVSGTFRQDGEHDIYTYNVNGLSGKFIFSKSNGIVQLNYTDSKISGSAGGPFTITDKNGVQYFFTTNGSLNSVESTTMQLADLNSSQPVNTGWYLTSITLPSGEAISFSYASKYTEESSTDGIVGTLMNSTVLTYGDDPGGPNGVNPLTPATQGPHQTTSGQNRSYSISYLTAITFSNGRLNFNYDSNSLFLNSIDVLNTQSSPLRHIQFTYEQTPGTSQSFLNNNAISLATVAKQDNAGNTVEKYSFGYYDNQLVFNAPQTDPNLYTDWWGYSNNNGNTFPYNTASSEGTSDVEGYGCTTCKTPYLNNLISGMLKTVTYPTGGTTEFDYEQNLDGSGNPGPGLRIKNIISNDGTGTNPLIRTFEYTPGHLLYQPDPMDFRTDLYIFFYQPAGPGVSLTNNGYYRQRTYTTTPSPTLSEAYQIPIYYDQVTEYQQNSSGANLGKTIYRYSIPLYTQGSSPKLFRTIYYTSPKLIEKSVYKYRSAQNDYFLIQDDGTAYETLNQSTIPQIRMQRNYSVPNDDSQVLAYRMIEESSLITRQWQTPGTPAYYACDNPIISGAEVPQYTTNTTYDDNGNSTMVQTNYTYNNATYIEPIKTETSTSVDNFITQYQYPADFPGTMGNISLGIANLFAKNIVRPIEVSTYRTTSSETNKRLISSKFYSYKPTIPAPDTIFDIESPAPVTDFASASVKAGAVAIDSRYNRRYIFDNYDNTLNLLQKHEVSGSPVSYQWGYNGQYPVAEVMNAANTYQASTNTGVKDFFYDSFEEGDSNMGAGTGKTGHYGYNGSYQHTVANMDNGSYILSYWLWSTATNTWSLVTKPATVSGNSYSITISGQIDDVRLYPADAQMTTYTYDPLVGMTSSTDAKGEITYYEYDAFQRLINIKDKNGNVVKHATYHYQGQ